MEYSLQYLLYLHETDNAMTQIVLNIENADIIPSLKKVLGQINGVSIATTSRKRTADKSGQEVLCSIANGYREVLDAQKNGTSLPCFDELIKEMKEEAAK